MYTNDSLLSATFFANTKNRSGVTHMSLGFLLSRTSSCRGVFLLFTVASGLLVRDVCIYG